MEIGKTKLALTASALAMALMLAGCGGSSSSGGVSSAGGGGGTTTPPATTPPTQEQLEAEKQKAAEAEKARKEAEEKLAKEEEEKRKAAADASLKDAMALFGAAVNSDGTHWDHLQGTLAFMPKYGGTTTVSGVTSFDREVKGEKLGKGGTVLDPVGKWSGTMVSAADKATATVPSDTVVIYTNVGEDAMRDYDEIHGSTVVTAAANVKKVAGSGFGTGNVAKDHLPGAKVSGTFDGASGTYTCGETACTSQAGADGGIELSAGWTFKANPGATVMVPDTKYSSFGWWLEKNLGAEAGDADVFKVHAFHNSTDDATVSDELSGTAKYMGPAVGKYAMVHDDGDGPSHTGGHFTAMADLMADFGTSTVPGGKVTGSIKDFVGGSDTMASWEVKLTSTATDGTGTGTAVWHIGDNKGQTGGTYSSSFREAGTDGDPQTLTGVWETHFDPSAGAVTGHMIGAFGATKQ